MSDQTPRSRKRMLGHNILDRSWNTKKFREDFRDYVKKSKVEADFPDLEISDSDDGVEDPAERANVDKGKGRSNDTPVAQPGDRDGNYREGDSRPFTKIPWTIEQDTALACCYFMKTPSGRMTLQFDIVKIYGVERTSKSTYRKRWRQLESEVKERYPFEEGLTEKQYAWLKLDEMRKAHGSEVDGVIETHAPAFFDFPAVAVSAPAESRAINRPRLGEDYSFEPVAAWSVKQLTALFAKYYLTKGDKKSRRKELAECVNDYARDASEVRSHGACVLKHDRYSGYRGGGTIRTDGQVLRELLHSRDSNVRHDAREVIDAMVPDFDDEYDTEDEDATESE